MKLVQIGNQRVAVNILLLPNKRNSLLIVLGLLFLPVKVSASEIFV